jgi:hypothetical protein
MVRERIAMISWYSNVCYLPTLSPVVTNSLSVEITGNPAPTVDSFKNLAPLLLLAFNILSYSARSPEYAFLFGVMTLMPFSNQVGYRAATSSEDVLSTKTTWFASEVTSLESCSVKVGKSGLSVDDERRDFQSVPGVMGFTALKMVRVEDVREINWNGERWAGTERSW